MEETDSRAGTDTGERLRLIFELLLLTTGLKASFACEKAFNLLLAYLSWSQLRVLYVIPEGSRLENPICGIFPC